MKLREHPIGELVGKCQTWDPSADGKGDFQYIDLSSIDKDSKKITTIETFPCANAPSRARQLVKTDDVLVATVRPNLNGVALCNGIHDGMTASTGYCVLRPRRDKLDPRYLFQWVKTETFVNRMVSVATGQSYPAVSDGKVKDSTIPLPPLAEQKRIAGILDAVDALRAKRREALAQLDTLLQATFLDLLGDPIENPKNWDTRTLPELILPGKNSLKRGPFGGALKKEIFVDSGYLVYEQNHALNNDYSFGRYFITEEKYRELIGFSVKPGDILISCSGVYLGKLSIVPHGAKPGIINQALLKVSLDQDKMKTVVFAYIFGSSQFKRKYFPSNRGVAIPNLPPMDVMKKIGFITPPVEVQQQFTAIVESIEQQRAQTRAHLAELDSLFASLQSRAFRGEL